MHSNSTRVRRTHATDPHVTPVGGSGRVTVVGQGEDAFLICRTVRGRGGWGVHCAAGELITSGWPTRTRARAYADRLLSQKAGAQG